MVGLKILISSLERLGLWAHATTPGHHPHFYILSLFIYCEGHGHVCVAIGGQLSEVHSLLLQWVPGMEHIFLRGEIVELNF